MTKRRLPRPSADRQAAAILRALSAWCAAKPGRRFSVEHGPDGWRATLDTRASAGGESMVDALAQVAQVATFEVLP